MTKLEITVGRGIYTSDDDNCFYAHSADASVISNKLRRRGYKVDVERIGEDSFRISFFKTKCNGTKYFDKYRSSGIVWGVYNPSVSDDILKQKYISFYGGVGREFARKPIIWRTKTRTLVTQIFGLDI